MIWLLNIDQIVYVLSLTERLRAIAPIVLILSVMRHVKALEATSSEHIWRELTRIDKRF